MGVVNKVATNRQTLMELFHRTTMRETKMVGCDEVIGMLSLDLYVRKHPHHANSVKDRCC